MRNVWASTILFFFCISGCGQETATSEKSPSPTAPTQEKPQAAVNFYNDGSTFFQNGEYDNAIDAFSKAIELHPGYAEAYDSRGVAWYKKNKFDQAITDHSHAIRLNEQDAIAYSNRALSRREKGNYKDAISDYHTAIRLNPSFDAALGGLAWILATCPVEEFRDADLAIEHANKACMLTGFTDVVHLKTLAAAYAEKGEFDEAIEWIEIVISQRTDSTGSDRLENMLRSFRRNEPYRDGTND